MHSSELVLMVLMYIMASIYFIAFYVLFFKSSLKRKRLIFFHKTIEAIASNNAITKDEMLEQLLLNYNKIFQQTSFKESKSLSNMLEQIIFCYDSYSEQRFKNLFGFKKIPNIRKLCFDLWKYKKEKEPFSALPAKESTLLNNINTAIREGNISLGEAMLAQLTQEIANKEILLETQKKNNQIATIMSAVGIILTIFFGVLSYR